MKSDLTAIFDGDPFGKLKAGEVQRVDKPYLSILGTTTPDGFYNSITGDDWRTGFLARWLFALPDSLPDFDSDSRLLTQTDEARLQGLAATLIKISARPGGDFTLDADAHHRWNTWRKEERRIDSYTYPKGCLTKPGMPNALGSHEQDWAGIEEAMVSALA